LVGYPFVLEDFAEARGEGRPEEKERGGEDRGPQTGARDEETRKQGAERRREEKQGMDKRVEQ
jgi:hypothetical protein